MELCDSSFCIILHVLVFLAFSVACFILFYFCGILLCICFFLFALSLDCVRFFLQLLKTQSFWCHRKKWTWSKMPQVFRLFQLGPRVPPSEGSSLIDWKVSSLHWYSGEANSATYPPADGFLHQVFFHCQTVWTSLATRFLVLISDGCDGHFYTSKLRVVIYTGKTTSLQAALPVQIRTFPHRENPVDAPCGKTKTTGPGCTGTCKIETKFRSIEGVPPWQSDGRKFSQPWGKHARRHLAKVNRVHAKSPVKFHGNNRNCRNRQLSSHHYIAQSRLNLINKSPYFPHAVHVTWSRKMPCLSGTSGGM